MFGCALANKIRAVAVFSQRQFVLNRFALLGAKLPGYLFGRSLGQYMYNGKERKAMQVEARAVMLILW